MQACQVLHDSAGIVFLGVVFTLRFHAEEQMMVLLQQLPSESEACGVI